MRTRQRIYVLVYMNTSLINYNILVHNSKTNIHLINIAPANPQRRAGSNHQAMRSSKSMPIKSLFLKYSNILKSHPI